MVETFPKRYGKSIGEYKEWLTSDFDCKCDRADCTTTLIDTDLVAGLEALTDVIGKPRLLSGYRCEAHNGKVGGSHNSQHLLGKAADIQSMFVKPLEIVAAAENIERFKNGGIGLYPTFTHVDVRDGMARWKQV